MDGTYFARSYAESPDIDGYITVMGENVAIHEIVNVCITGVSSGLLTGVLV